MSGRKLYENTNNFANALTKFTVFLLVVTMIPICLLSLATVFAHKIDGTLKPDMWSYPISMAYER